MNSGTPRLGARTELGEHGSKDIDAPVERFARDGQRRGKADHRFMCVLGQDTALGHALGYRSCRHGRFKLDANPQSTAAHGTNQG